MVRRGCFSLQLINTETGMPFQEHYCQRDGLYYAEVEPDAEYWIRIQAHQSLKYDTDDDNSDYNNNVDEDDDGYLVDGQVFKCKFQVDGKDLGYSAYISRNQQSDLGLWCRTSHDSKVDRALRVHKVPLLDNNSSTSMPYWIGCVQVDVFIKADVDDDNNRKLDSNHRNSSGNAEHKGKDTNEYDDYNDDKEHKNKKSKRDHSNVSSRCCTRGTRESPQVVCTQGDKIVLSIPGKTTTETKTTSTTTATTTTPSNKPPTKPTTTTTSKTQQHQKCTPSYTATVSQTYFHGGKFLKTMKLYYCTAPGLVSVGVLPPPDNGPFHPHQSNKNNITCRSQHHVLMKPTFIKQQTFTNGIVTFEKSVELFDLTNNDNDDEELNVQHGQQIKSEESEDVPFLSSTRATSLFQQVAPFVHGEKYERSRSPPMCRNNSPDHSYHQRSHSPSPHQSKAQDHLRPLHQPYPSSHRARLHEYDRTSIPPPSLPSPRGYQPRRLSRPSSALWSSRGYSEHTRYTTPNVHHRVERRTSTSR